jgi:hypothetical protein
MLVAMVVRFGGVREGGGSEVEDNTYKTQQVGPRNSAAYQSNGSCSSLPDLQLPRAWLILLLIRLASSRAHTLRHTKGPAERNERM